MLNFFKPKKKIQSVELQKKDLQSEIESLLDYKPGMHINPKDMGTEYLVDVIIEKNIIGIVSERARERVPQNVVFLVIILQGYPHVPPQILAKSDFFVTSLKDGRDLMSAICPEWNDKSCFKNILDGFLPFLSLVINTNDYKFYGTFHLGAIYHLKNFDNMIVVISDCTVEEIDKKNKIIKSLSTTSDYILILTEDSFLIFEKIDTSHGKLVFWSTLFSISNLQLNKSKKKTVINFYDDESNSDYLLKLKVDNILLFRDSLVKKMRNLKIKVESQKLFKGQILKRLSEREIRSMKIVDIEKNIQELKERIIKGEINEYTINTFTALCGKATEYYAEAGNEKYKEYNEMIKNILKLEGVDEHTKKIET